MSDDESSVTPTEAKHAGGRPPWVPTEQELAQVETMSAMGIPHDDMCKIIGVDAKTLRKHCRQQLDQGSIKATIKVAGVLFKQATEENNTAAMIFWMKARAGWSEKTRTELTGPDGGPLEVKRIERIVIDPRRDSADPGSQGVPAVLGDGSV